MANVVVLGAGALSFGLLLPALADCGHAVTVATRVNASEQHDRLSAISRRREVRVAHLWDDSFDVLSLDRVIDLSEQRGLADLRSGIGDGWYSVVVTAARSGFDPVADVICTAAARREPPILLVSADNSPADAWAHLREQPVPGVRAIASIADRVCVRFPRTHPTADVLIERYGRWVVESDADGRIDDLVTGAPLIRSTSDVDVAFRRKLHLVNGLHLALALLAWTDGEPALHRWVERNVAMATEVADDVGRAYEATYPSDPVNSEPQVDEILERFRSTPDRAGRMLGLSEGQVTGHSFDLRRRVDERLTPILGDRAAYGPALGRVMQIAGDLADRWMTAGGHS